MQLFKNILLTSIFIPIVVTNTPLSPITTTLCQSNKSIQDLFFAAKFCFKAPIIQRPTNQTTFHTGILDPMTITSLMAVLALASVLSQL